MNDTRQNNQLRLPFSSEEKSEALKSPGKKGRIVHGEAHV